MPRTAARRSAPPLPIRAGFVLVLTSLVAVAGARLAGYSPVQDLGPAAVAQSRLIGFEDAADGGVHVTDAATGALIAVAEPGTNGFLRGTLRGLMRVRKAEHLDRNAPWRLELLANGQLILTDTARDVKIDLNAFGHTNAGVFAAFLSTTGDKS